MRYIRTTLMFLISIACLSGGGAVIAATPAGERYLLIDRDHAVRMVSAVVLEERELHFRDEAGTMRSQSTTDLIALFRMEYEVRHRSSGMLILDDGQRLPGFLTSRTSTLDDGFVWMHPWLGEVEASTEQVRQLVLDSEISVPTGGAAVRDLLLLRNGDRLEGFIVAIGDPFVLEVTTGDVSRLVEIPMERVAAARLVTPSRPASGTRGWFRDGTVMSMTDRRIGDDGYVRVGTPWMRGNRSLQISAGEIAGILFDPGALVPLSQVSPVSVMSDVPRFETPIPDLLDPGAPLGSGAIEFRGPLRVQYVLDVPARRMIGEVVLPESAREWGDLEFVVRSEGLEVFRQRINSERPRTLLDVPLRGPVLDIELVEGPSGLVHNRVRLERAFLIQ